MLLFTLVVVEEVHIVPILLVLEEAEVEVLDKRVVLMVVMEQTN